MMTAKPDEPEPRNSSLVSGRLTSVLKTPFPLGWGFCVARLSSCRAQVSRIVGCEQKKAPDQLARGFPYCGADDGNRTRVICLEGRGSTIELHPRTPEGDTQDPSVKRPRARHLESPPV